MPRPVYLTSKDFLIYSKWIIIKEWRIPTKVKTKEKFDEIRNKRKLEINVFVKQNKCYKRQLKLLRHGLYAKKVV